jgi:Flp pilus assembly protein protease CpaA
MVVTMLVLLLFFGIAEERISYLSFFWPVALFVFLAFIYMLNQALYMAGGDVKYLMLSGLYLDFNLFPYFLLLCAVLQFVVLIYIQKIKKRRYVAMVPVMFSSAIIIDLNFFGII